MADVVVSKLARKDLLATRDYIRDELGNPEAARRIMQALKQGMASLGGMPERGKPLDALLAVHTEYRFLAVENYRIFYLCDGRTVEVIRVLHTRQDFMRALFF